MAADRIAHSHPPAGSIIEVLRSAKVWSMVFVYTGLAIAAVLLLAGTAVAVFVIPHARLRRPEEMSGEISGEQPPLPELPAQHPAGR
jgi:hypothetical protein